MARGGARGARGSGAKHRGGPRADRDGDLKMDTVKTRGGVSKSSGRGKDPVRKSLRDARDGGKAGILSEKAQGQILRHAALGDQKMAGKLPGRRGDLTELKITGWDRSASSSSADRGVGSLIRWLETKASNRLGSKTRQVKIKKSRTEASELFISVPAQDVGPIMRQTGYEWAKAKIVIERLDKPANSAPESSETADVRALLRGVLERRYNPGLKLLDLSALGQDEELQKKHVFDSTTTTAKIFPALMKVLELSFDTDDERHAAILSVSLASNQLTDVSAVTVLSQTLARLQNLDISNNKIENLSGIANWKKRFHYLQHLVLTGNPLEQNQPEYPQEVIQWYPNLRMLNNIQVRTEEDIQAKNAAISLSFPIRSPLFQDEGGIAENFIRTFFAGFDSDRAALANLYYDDNSDFSYAVNTSAPRDPATVDQQEKVEWSDYIKNSRNLKKVSHLPSRMNRSFKGAKSVGEAFLALPKTKHPDLASEARKWMIEAHILPNVPDPTGQASGGVDGFMITVHGEFEESALSGVPTKKRSYDRTFIVGPGGPSGVRIQNDMLTVRAYGGTEAYEAENFQPLVPQAAPPKLPEGLSVEMAEQMVVEVMTQTGMTMNYAKDCLEQVGWDFQKGLEVFASVKATLPAEAFVQNGV